MNKIFFIFFLTTTIYAKPNYWLGLGILGESQKSNLIDNQISKMITWGLGLGFLSTNLVFLEVGYGLDSDSSYDSSVDRTSFVKIGYEKFFKLHDIIAYSGAAFGGIIRTIEAKKRSQNWQIGDESYDFEGNTKRSVVTPMFEINLGTRLFSSDLLNFSLDWNTLSLIYNQGRIKYLTSINIVFMSGR